MYVLMEFIILLIKKGGQDEGIYGSIGAVVNGTCFASK